MTTHTSKDYISRSFHSLRLCINHRSSMDTQLDDQDMSTPATSSTPPSPARDASTTALSTKLSDSQHTPSVLPQGRLSPAWKLAFETAKLLWIWNTKGKTEIVAQVRFVVALRSQKHSPATTEELETPTGAATFVCNTS